MTASGDSTLTESRYDPGAKPFLPISTVTCPGVEPVIPVRRDSKVKDALKVGKDFVTRGAQRLVELFRGRWSVERLFGRAKEWLLLGCFRLRGL